MIPTRGKILVEVLSDQKVLPSGIIIAETVRETPHHGRVVAVGSPGVNRWGKEIQPCAQPGDIVHFKKQYHTFWEKEGKKYVFLRNEDITGKEQ